MTLKSKHVVVVGGSSGIGVAVRGTDEAHAGAAFFRLREKIFDQQQVIEFEWQRGAAYRDDLFFHGSGSERVIDAG